MLLYDFFFLSLDPGLFVSAREFGVWASFRLWRFTSVPRFVSMYSTRQSEHAVFFVAAVKLTLYDDTCTHMAYKGVNLVAYPRLELDMCSEAGITRSPGRVVCSHPRIQTFRYVY
jgi:hypothetical protein